MRAPLIALLVFGLCACSEDNEGDDEPADTADATASDVVPADVAQDVDDVPPEPVDPAWAAVPDPTDRLWAGTAERDLGFPVGAGTVGYAPGAAASSPYAVMFPGTDAQHTDLTAKAIVLRNGGSALAMVRTDTIGIWQDMVRDVMVRLRELGRADLAQGLIVAATHTHSSGGRVFDHPVGEIAVGPFLPGFYMRVRDAMVEAVIAADAAAVPARAGHTTLQIASLHKDRRCENGPVQDDSMGVLQIEDDAGEAIAYAVNYSMHGTTLGGGWTLSSDAPGAVERGIEHGLPSGAPVLFFQSWAGDMAPQVPSGYLEDASAPEYRENLRDLDAIEVAAGELVAQALPEIETRSDLVVDVATYTFPLDAELINPDGSFAAYPYGGIWCVPDKEDNCGEDAVPYTSANLACLPFDEDMTVKWGQITAARVGDLGFVTLPGEPCTSVGVALRDAAIEATGLSQVFVVGYAQGYLSYLLHPDDFWMGGYEAASVLMGPHFGEYLVAIGAQIARSLVEPDAALGFEPVELATPTAALHYDALDVPEFEGEPAFVEDAAVGEDRVVSARWIGGPPALDMPLVTLEVQTADGWEPRMRTNGSPWTSREAEMVLRLEPDPPYSEPSDARTFHWTLWFGLDRDTWSEAESLSGVHRLRIGGNAQGPYELLSGPVTF